MKNGGVDKRIIKTKCAIHNAFKNLIQIKDMADISISELTEAAQVTRSTFYMYYDSVSDVRDDIEDAILKRLDELMDETDLAMVFINPYPLLSMLAEEIVRFDEKNKYILSENNSGRLLAKISQKIVDTFIAYLKETGKGDPARGKYITVFFAAGIMESFKMWYNHQSSLSLEELCRRMSGLVKKGLDVVTEIN